MACLAHSLFLVLTFASSFALKLSSEQTTDVYQRAYQDLTRRYSKRVTTNMMKLLDVNDSKKAEPAAVAARVHVACNIASTVADFIILELGEVDPDEFRPSGRSIKLPRNKSIKVRTLSKSLGSVGKVLALMFKVSAASGLNASIPFPDSFAASQLTTWEAISEVIEPALLISATLLKYASKCWTREVKGYIHNRQLKEQLTEKLAGLMEKGKAIQDEGLSPGLRRRLSYSRSRDFDLTKGKLKQTEERLNKTAEEVIKDHKWCTAEIVKILSLNFLNTLFVTCEAVSKMIMNSEQERAIEKTLEDAAAEEDTA